VNLLLVDDDPMNIEYFVDALEGAGHSVTVERTGPSGLARGRAGSFDIILLDIQLPGGSGLELVAALRADGVRCPILALTSAAMQGDAEHAIAQGFDEYLTKPISPNALRAAVGRYANRAP
jgi:two-component system cell cycle response regulator